jgi:hypothetical protein
LLGRAPARIAALAASNQGPTGRPSSSRADCRTLMRRLSCKAKAREVVRDFRPVCCLAKCSIPDDHIDPRRSALFMARSILREVREGFEHADLSAQAGDDDAEDPCRDPDQQRTGLAGGRALRDLRADGLEMAGSRRRPRPEPHAAPLADDADACAGGRPSRLHSARLFSCRSTSGSRWCARSSTRMSLARGSTAARVGTGRATCGR